MKFQKLDIFSGLLSLFVSLLGGLFVICSGTSLSGEFLGTLSGGIFCFDTISFYLCTLSTLLLFSLWYFFLLISRVSSIMILVSVLCSLMSYCCAHSLWFWIFYELSILPLLFLLAYESPYSERYVASWYLLGYVVFTSLPMLLIIMYLSLTYGGFYMNLWFLGSGIGFGAFLSLAALFVTKIPLPPFHTWLPIVHAEATSPVSVCLSGYIMKLGILGVCRFCSYFLPSHIFCEEYLIIVLAISILFFFNACRELDGKRWLAFMSLSHIMISCVCLGLVGQDGFGLAFLYCLGHGLSAAVMFILLWIIYEVSGSRNWVILKSGVTSSLMMRCLAAACICTVASLPPTAQFFCEVYVLLESGLISVLFIFFFVSYLFLSGLVPLFLLGGLLTRHCSVSFGGGYIFGLLGSVFFLIFWSFLLFLVG